MSGWISSRCATYGRRARVRRWALALPVPAIVVFGVSALLSGRSAQAAAAPPPIGWSSGPSLPSGFGVRWDYSVAYLPTTDQVVVFGGAPDIQSGSWKNDTWLYTVSTNAWTQGPAAPSALEPRSGAAMAYDPAIGKLVLFGGSGTEWPPYSDTWYFDGTSWTQGPSAPAQMGGRVGAGMVYDDALGKLVLFSGSGTDAYNDTWFFDGTAWTAGPASPAALKSRVFFPMSYDQIVGKVIVAGGDGALDTWAFDGSTWTAGPNLPDAIGPQDRFHMLYVPQLGANILFGGIGPVAAHGDAWLYRPADGSWILMSPGSFKPGNRLDAQMVWVPTKDALMLIGGETDANDGTPLTDTYFFRDVPPQQSSLIITPADPNMTQSVTMVGGGQVGGYGGTGSDMQWFVNGVLVPDATGPVLLPVYGVGDQIQAQLRMHDSLNVYGPWVSSPVVTVVDRAPSISSTAVNPQAPVLTDPLSAYVVASDPDGDPITDTYAWTVNGASVGGNTDTLATSYFNANDSVGLTVTATDSHGQSGTPVSAVPVTIGYNLTVDPAVPGGKPRTQGKGYAPSEPVDIRIDAPTGTVLGTATTDGIGKWAWVNIPLPAQLSGGTHMMYGTGRTSGKVGQGPVQISAAGSILPTKFAAGTSVTFTGVGFVPAEVVAVSFPNQTPTNVVADSNGNANVTMVSPPEPNTGGVVTAAAPSGTITCAFTVTPALIVPANGVPGGTASVSVTGYKAVETVNFNFDTGAAIASGMTDANGSLSITVPITGYFGSHTLYAKGASSGISVSKSLPFKATLTLSPTSGPRGTVVTIVSGPGWKPNTTLTFKVGSRTLTPKTTDSNGSVNFTYTIQTADPLGPLVIKLYSSGLKQTASGTFTVTG